MGKRVLIGAKETVIPLSILTIFPGISFLCRLKVCRQAQLSSFFPFSPSTLLLFHSMISTSGPHAV